MTAKKSERSGKTNFWLGQLPAARRFVSVAKAGLALPF
jgi:hypothetical protein